MLFDRVRGILFPYNQGQNCLTLKLMFRAFTSRHNEQHSHHKKMKKKYLSGYFVIHHSIIIIIVVIEISEILNCFMLT
jgi:hypothetical protein